MKKNSTYLGKRWIAYKQRTVNWAQRNVYMEEKYMTDSGKNLGSNQKSVLQSLTKIASGISRAFSI